MQRNTNDITGTELVEVHENVWAWIQHDGSWWINNAGLVGGSDGDVLVDTCATRDRTSALLAAVAQRRGGLNLRFAVNTHLHGDHTYGNCLLPESTTLIGHQNMRDGLERDTVIDGCPPVWSPVPDWGKVTKRLPALTFTSALRLHSGATRIDVIHPGYAAHTTGDCVVWLPEKKILFCGDLLFHGLTPLVFMGSIDGAVRALDWIAAFDPTYVVPGHGPLIGPGQLQSVLAEHARYYAFVAQVGKTGLERGLSPLEAAKASELGEFAQWADRERIVLNVHRYYADREDREIDILAAFADAVKYNGGPLATHV